MRCIRARVVERPEVRNNFDIDHSQSAGSPAQRRQWSYSETTTRVTSQKASLASKAHREHEILYSFDVGVGRVLCGYVRDCAQAVVCSHVLEIVYRDANKYVPGGYTCNIYAREAAANPWR